MERAADWQSEGDGINVDGCSIQRIHTPINKSRYCVPFCIDYRPHLCAIMGLQIYNHNQVAAFPIE